jgi:hypothetical protein
MLGWHIKENHDVFAGFATAARGLLLKEIGKVAGAREAEEGKWNGPMK